MADYYYGAIEFPTAALNDEDIAKEVRHLEHDVFDDYEQFNGVYTASADSVRYGYFRELEELLNKHNVPYKRTCGALGDEAPEETFSNPNTQMGYSWYLSSTSGIRLAPIDEIISSLKTALAHEDDGMALEATRDYLESLQSRYPVADIDSFVTSFEGELAAEFSIQVTSDITLHVKRPYRDLILYQCTIGDKMGLIYKAKPIYVMVDGEERCTFFTEGGKQYWLHEMG